MIVSTIIACAGCEGGADKSSLKGLDLEPPTKGLDPEHHPQSPLLRAGALEWYNYFRGNVDANGKLVPKGAASAPTSGQIEGNRRALPPPSIPSHVTFKYVEDDPCTKTGELPLYLVTDGNGTNLCADQDVRLAAISELTYCGGSADQQQQLEAFNKIHELAVAIPGRWNDNGQFFPNAPADADPKVTLACITGIVAKCAHWGYLPWKTGGTNNEQLDTYHTACVRAARAEYRGDGNVFTCAATEIDIFDQIGIQPRTNPTGMEEEAFWNETKATCIKRPRYTACDPPIEPLLDGCDPSSWKIGVWSKRGVIPRIPGETKDQCPESKTFPPPGSSNYCRRR